MFSLKYSDKNGHGEVHASSICVYVTGSEINYMPVNPIFLISPYGTYYFGDNIVLFQTS